MRVELRRLAWRFLSTRFAGLSMARILCPLLPDRGSGFNLLWCSRGKYRSSLGRDDSGQLSFRLQVPSRDNAYLPATRLQRRVKFVPSRDRAARAKAPGHFDPASTVVCAKGGKIGAS